MTSILKRAALAAALTTAATATVLTSAGSAQAYFVGIGTADPVLGLAAVQADYGEWLTWGMSQSGVCTQIVNDVNAGRKNLGLTRTISVDECTSWMSYCMEHFTGNAYWMIPADNGFYCADPE
jgi:hypothetical protein